MSVSHDEASRVPWVLEAKHRIFLSHSGAQKAFVAQLNENFKACHRYPFFDVEHYSLPPGESFPAHIFQAIQQCDVGVVVLSEEFFTRSHWPMTELVRMVNSKKKKRIVPIFLHVSPEDLKKDDNVARWISQWEAWKEESKGRIDIGEWKGAFEELRKVSGLVRKVGRYEFEFLSEIVKAVNRMVPEWSRWDDTHVQGRWRICQAIRNKVSAIEGGSSGRPRVVGLYGVGGIGKTTACKCMVNDYFDEFDGRVCHIEFNYTSTYKERFQEVLRRLTNSNRDVLERMSEDQCYYWCKTMQFEKVFLALDNVSCDTIVKEEVLIYLQANYHPDSIVLVAARSRDELVGLEINVDHCLAMPELEKDEARAIFLKHLAKSRMNADNVDAGLVNHCVQRCNFDKGDGSGTCHYHPLALKVFGDQLGDELGRRSPKDWISFINGVDVFNLRGEQEHRLFSVLRSSFDSEEALEVELQGLFMDVALFNSDVVCHIFEELWDDGDDAGEDRSITFQEKLSFFQWLAVVNEEFKVISKGQNMHHLFPKLERLKRKSLLEVISDGKSAIGMHDLWREFALRETERGEIKERRWVYEKVAGEAVESILNDGGWKKLQRISLVVDYQACNIHPSVRCLDFSNCKNVTVLRLVDVVVEDDAGLDLSPLIQLKILEIHADKRDPVRVHGFGKLKNLRILAWVNIGVESFDTLKEVSHLTNLRVLHLVSTGQGPPATLELSKLFSLEYLRVYFPDAVEVTVSGLSSKMANLRMVDFFLREGFWSCPGVGDVTNLEVLSFCQCEHLVVLPDLKKLSKLRILVVSHCKSLKTIQGLENLIALEEFRADHCEKLNGVPVLSGLKNLRRLDLMYCHQVHHIPGLSNLIALQELHASGKILDTGPELQRLRNLESVSIGLKDRWWGSLRVVDLEVLEPVLSLDVSGVHRKLRNLGKLSNLQRLVIDKCKFDALHGLDQLSALKTLELTDVFVRLLDLGKLARLESLFISGCEVLKVISGSLPALKSISISGCRRLEEWPGVDLLPSLTSLSLRCCGLKLNELEVGVLKARCHFLNVLKSSLDFPSEDICVPRYDFDYEATRCSREKSPRKQKWKQKWFGYMILGGFALAVGRGILGLYYGSRRNAG